MEGGANVWLVGMMGAGKSAVGPLLAARLGVPFHDADAHVAAEAGHSIPEIFAHEGEAGFRRRERAAIVVLAQEGGVVALGGGAIAQPGAARWLGARGTVVYLRAHPRTLAERIGDAAERPMLAGLAADERLAHLEALLEERMADYASAAITVDTDDLAPEEIVDRIVAGLEAAAP